MTSRFLVGIVLLLAGCPVGVADDQEDIDANGGVDSAPGTSGLTVTWDCIPMVPGPVTSDLRVDEARLLASSLRLIGDSAAPGDMRTTRIPVDLRWRENNGSYEAPADIVLNAAPPGLYSRIEIGTGGNDELLTIEGEVRIDGEWKDFEIRDERPHAIVKNIVLTLAPGQHKTVPITMDVALILASVPFDELQNDDGTLKFPSDDPRLDAVWAAVDTSFTVPTAFGNE